MLLGLLARDAEPPVHYGPNRTLRTEPPRDYDNFDRAEFLRHMRGLIKKRRTAKDSWRKQERAALDAIMRNEEASGQFAPPPPPRPPPKPPPIVPVWHLPTYYTQQPQPQNVEPWFQPDRELTKDDLIQIARYALMYFASAMRATQPGLWHAGDYMAHTMSARNADSIAGALYPLAKSLPPSAHLSSVPLPLPDPLPDGIVGVTLALNVGAIHLAVRDNQNVVMAFTYDT